MNKIEKCDKCGGWINNNNECFCGTWVEKYRDVPALLLFEKALLCFDQHCEQTNSDKPISGDHWSGNCYVFFKGNYELCEEIKKFILEKKQK